MKTSPKRSYSVIEKERFGLVFAKTMSIISGTVRTVASICQDCCNDIAFAVRSFNHSAGSHPIVGYISSTFGYIRLELIHSQLDHIHSQLDLILSQLDLIHALLDLILSQLDLIHALLDLQKSSSSVIQFLTNLRILHKIVLNILFLLSLSDFIQYVQAGVLLWLFLIGFQEGAKCELKKKLILNVNHLMFASLY